MARNFCFLASQSLKKALKAANIFGAVFSDHKKSFIDCLSKEGKTIFKIFKKTFDVCWGQTRPLFIQETEDVCARRCEVKGESSILSGSSCQKLAPDERHGLFGLFTENLPEGWLNTTDSMCNCTAMGLVLPSLIAAMRTTENTHRSHPFGFDVLKKLQAGNMEGPGKHIGKVEFMVDGVITLLGTVSKDR